MNAGTLLMAIEARPTTGTVTEVLPNTTFRVALSGGSEILAYLAGKMRRNYLRISKGDRVSVELSADDPARGKITGRFR